VLEIAERDRPRALVVDLSAAATIDLDGADVLTRVHGELARKNVKLMLAHLGDEHLELLDRAGTLAAIGEENVFPPMRSAVGALIRDDGGDGVTTALHEPAGTRMGP
jgi:MFS superfamily sulfate permease-like transporter